MPIIELTPTFVQVATILTGVLFGLTFLSGIFLTIFGKDNGLGEGMLKGSIIPFLMFVFFLVLAA